MGLRDVVPAARALVLSCHPGPTLAVTVLAVPLTVAAGGDAAVAVHVTLVVLVGQLSIGWSNDWLDAARDAAVGRTDKPVAAHTVSAATVRGAAWVGLALCVPLSLSLGVRAAVAHLVVVAGGWAYNLGLKATAWSWLSYAVSFAALPAVAVLALPGAHAPAWWLLATGSLLGVGAHLTNALPDLEDDRATGVNGMPHRLGRRTTGIVAPLLLASGSVVVALAPAGPPTVVGWAGLAVAVAVLLAAGMAAATRPASRLPFAASIVVALVDVVLLVVTGSALAV